MILSADRLASMLAADGFRRTVFTPESRPLVFSRPSELEGVFDRISVMCSGSHGEGVAARAGISLVHGGSAILDFVRDVFMRELAGPDGRGWCVVRNRAMAQQWEDRLVSAAPYRCGEVRDSQAVDLLHQTQGIRDLVAKYRHAWGTNAPVDLWTRLEPRVGEAEKRRAHELARLPGVALVSGAHDTYAAVILGIMLHSSAVEGRQVFADVTEFIDDRVLYGCVQMLVDVLSSFGPDAARAE